MDPIKPSAADALRAEIGRALTSSPFFVKKALDHVPSALVTWINSVEARLAALQKMPSAEALRVLALTPEQTAAAEERGRKAAALIARGNCEDCHDG